MGFALLTAGGVASTPGPPVVLLPGSAGVFITQRCQMGSSAGRLLAGNAGDRCGVEALRAIAGHPCGGHVPVHRHRRLLAAFRWGVTLGVRVRALVLLCPIRSSHLSTHS